MTALRCEFFPARKCRLAFRGAANCAATRLDTLSTGRHASPNLATLGASEQACIVFAGIVQETSCVLAQCLHIHRVNVLLPVNLWQGLAMPKGDKGKYSDKQKRKAEHIAEGYEDRGDSPRKPPNVKLGRQLTKRAAAARKAARDAARSPE